MFFVYDIKISRTQRHTMQYVMAITSVMNNYIDNLNVKLQNVLYDLHTK